MTGPAAGNRRAIQWGAEAVSVSFGGLRALDQVSVGVRPGEVTAVVGGDGAGKTTLLRCVAGALAPSGGAVRRPGAQRIGYLPPSTGVYDDLSVAENLEFRSAVFGITGAAASRQVGEYLERTGLAAARDRLAGQLSGEPVPRRSEPGPLQVFTDAAADHRAGNAEDGRTELKVLRHREVVVHSGAWRQVSDPLRARPANRALSHGQRTRDAAQQRGLARAVAAYHGGDLAGPDADADLV